MSQEKISSVLRDARRIVVKVGSSLVTNEGRGLDETAIGEWSRQLAALVRGDGVQRREVIMVSSGAIAEGMKRLGWSRRPREVHVSVVARRFMREHVAGRHDEECTARGRGPAQREARG